MSIDGEVEDRLRRRLGRTSAVMLKFFLRYRELAAGMNDTHEQVIDRIIAYVKNKELPLKVLKSSLAEFQEYNNKRVYLYQAPLADIQAVDVSKLPKLAPNRSSVIIPSSPTQPAVCYSCADDDEICIVFAETHRRPDIDIGALSVSLVPVLRIIVIRADRATGFVSIAYDAPERVKAHTNSASYYAHYHSQAQHLLGTKLTSMNLTKALKRLMRSSLVEIPYNRGFTINGQVDLVSPRDCRDIDVYEDVKTKIKIHNRGRYIWLAEPNGDEDHDELSPTSPLLRDVPTEIFAATGLVRFTKDCLREEVTYVLQQLRAHAA